MRIMVSARTILIGMLTAVVAATLILSAMTVRDELAPEAPTTPSQPGVGQPERVPPGFVTKEGMTAEPYGGTGWAREIVHDKTGIEMVFVPAGEFAMGSRWSTPYREIRLDGRPTRVDVPFYIGKYEVTVAQWRRLMGDMQRYIQLGPDDYPVTHVTWKECVEFCDRAGDGMRLPTEIQWEHACRAQTVGGTWFGSEPEELSKYAWWAGNLQEDSELHSVGGKLPNPWGLYDVLGNAAEWCEEPYLERPPSKREKEGLGFEIIESWGWQARVIRGGSFAADWTKTSAGSRVAGCETDAYGDTGFRVALGTGAVRPTVPVESTDAS